MLLEHGHFRWVGEGVVTQCSHKESKRMISCLSAARNLQMQNVGVMDCVFDTQCLWYSSVFATQMIYEVWNKSCVHMVEAITSFFRKETATLNLSSELECI